MSRPLPKCIFCRRIIELALKGKLKTVGKSIANRIDKLLKSGLTSVGVYRHHSGPIELDRLVSPTCVALTRDSRPAVNERRLTAALANVEKSISQ